MAATAVRQNLQNSRIGFFTSVEGMGGSEVLVFDALHAALQAGAIVTCWCPAGAYVRTLAQRAGVDDAIEFRSWPPEQKLAVTSEAQPVAIGSQMPRSKPVRKLWQRLCPMGVRRMLGFRRDASRLASSFRDAGISLIFVNVNGSEAATFAARRARILTLGCYHLSVEKKRVSAATNLAERILQAWSMHACHRVIHTSKRARDQWNQRCAFPERKTVVIYNGVPLGELPSSTRGTGLTLAETTPSPFVFCCPARLHPIKGHRVLIEAVRLHSHELGNAQVFCCGDGDIKDELQSLASHAGVADIVQFLGHRDDLKAILQTSHCAVLPSIASENLSVAILEAGNLALPAIVTNVGGMAEAIVDGKTGFVVPPGDADALGKAMVQIIRRADRLAMGKAAQERVRASFSLERMQNEYVEVFAQALAKQAESQV